MDESFPDDFLKDFYRFIRDKFYLQLCEVANGK